MFCWGAALGLDFIEGLEEDHPWNLHTLLTKRYALDEWALDRFDEDAYDAIRHFSKSLEEAIEMLAMSILMVPLHEASGGRTGRPAGPVPLSRSASPSRGSVGLLPEWERSAPDTQAGSQAA